MSQDFKIQASQNIFELVRRIFGIYLCEMVNISSINLRKYCGHSKPFRMLIGLPESLIWRASTARSFRFSLRRHLRVPLRGFAHTHDENATFILDRTRNIGIIAHIDAVDMTRRPFPQCYTDTIKGKTTTTERMLYYSGHTRRLGSM